jgi:hypothetical protein
MKLLQCYQTMKLYYVCCYGVVIVILMLRTSYLAIYVCRIRMCLSVHILKKQVNKKVQNDIITF